ncbi:MAG: glycosyltransferase family 4 protein, partial [Vicinamibacterales bacterium]
MHVTLVAGAMREVDSRPFTSAGITLHSVALPGATAWREVARAAWSAVRAIPYVCYGRHDRAAVRTALSREIALHSPSVLYLDHLDSLAFAGLAPAGTRRVIDLHNVYSQLIERNAGERSGATAAYLRREARLLAGAERRATAATDALFAVSESDQQYFRRFGRAPVYVVPNG